MYFSTVDINQVNVGKRIIPINTPSGGTIRKVIPTATVRITPMIESIFNNMVPSLKVMTHSDEVTLFFL